MKKLFALILCLCISVSLVACGGSGDSTDSSTAGTDTSSDPATSSGDIGDGTTADVAENLVLAMDQQAERVVLYDMDLLGEDGNIDDAEVWELRVGWAAGLKYREDTVFGDVIIIAGNESAIYSYPEGRKIWSTTNSGNNPHSIEILPSGNVVIASSTGATLRLFYSSAILNGDLATAKNYVEYPLKGAHGALWDPEYETFWALGDNELVGYAVKGSGTNETLQAVNGLGAALPADNLGGHDLAADLTDTQYLFVTVNSRVYRFDKETSTFNDKFPQYAKLTEKGVKGFGNTTANTYFYTFPNGGEGRVWENDSKADWCTDTIYFCYWKTENFMYKQACVSEKCAYYKCRVFYGQYQ